MPGVYNQIFAIAFVATVALAEFDSVHDGASLLQTHGLIGDDPQLAEDKAQLNQGDTAARYASEALRRQAVSDRAPHKLSGKGPTEFFEPEGAFEASRAAAHFAGHASEIHNTTTRRQAGDGQVPRYTVVGDSVGCGDDSTMFVTATSSVEDCAKFAKKAFNRGECDENFEFRQESQECRCNRVGSACTRTQDTHAALYRLTSVTPSVAARACVDGDARAMHVDTPTEGQYFYPEVLYSGEWYPICGHGFWANNGGAEVVCKLFGFTTGVFKKTYSTFSKDAMPLGKCRSGDQRLESCGGGFNGWGVLDFKGGKCNAGAAIGVQVACSGGAFTGYCSAWESRELATPSPTHSCTDGDARPMNIDIVTAGQYFYPEVFDRGEWYPICGHGFWANNGGAEVVCKLFGFTTGVFQKTYNTFTKDAMPVGKCRSGDRRLESCSGGFNGWGVLDFKSGKCQAGKAVGVQVACSGGAFTGFCSASPATSPPTESPTATPTQSPTQTPTQSPTQSPTESPTATPTQSPTQTPTQSPTQSPTHSPTKTPTQSPTQSPTASPTATPTPSPTMSPTHSPTRSPTQSPTQSPTGAPTRSPTPLPTQSPTGAPTQSPTAAPTESPTLSPTHSPTRLPTQSPTQSPTAKPTHSPTESPTGSPTGSPTESPTESSPAAPAQTSGLAPFGKRLPTTASAVEEVKCDLGCNACGYNWYQNQWRGGNPTSLWNQTCDCCGGIQAQQDVCKALCIFSEQPPTLEGFAYGSPSESRKNGWYDGCVHRVSRSGPVHGMTIDECRQMCVDNNFTLEEGVTSVAGGVLGQYAEAPFCDAFSVHIPGWANGDRKGGCRLQNFANNKQYCGNWSGGYWDFYYEKLQVDAPSVVPAPLNFRGANITENNIGGSGPGASSRKYMHLRGVTEDFATDMLVTNATPYHAWKAAVNGFSTPNSSLAQLSLACGDRVTLRFSLVDSQTLAPKRLKNFSFTVADLDQGSHGRCKESIEVADYYTAILPPNSSVVRVVDQDIGITRFIGTAQDTHKEAPACVESMSDDEWLKAVTFSFTNTQSFTVTFYTDTDVNSSSKDPRVVGWAGRRFLFG